jgi:hypothetical protein
MPKHTPLLTLKEISFTAVKEPKDFFKLLTAITG